MIAIIPARGGSKGVPGKNIKNLNGKPLIQYTIEAAKEIFENKQILLSTDNECIRKIGVKLGLEVPFLRPAHLSHDSSGTYEVLIHAIKFLNDEEIYPEKLILLQPTSPFRTSKHIVEALNIYNENLDMVVSVKETKANPYYILREENEDGFLEPSKNGNFKRRQDCPKVWELNGAIYIINVASLKSKPISEFTKVKKYVMDELSSHDIDTHIDFELAKILMKN